ncbi:hypothetical protein AB4K20DRAFT_1590369 [Rhizopus microsporus]|uniref:Uncharacterized protein n=1 Tax=Rhizopus microsporus TaxID=58291 RepID=A0A1X0RV66_RHIZD|nr:hypothetical protein BCV71DRAFT_257114 [Rhizopus microsporus]
MRPDEHKAKESRKYQVRKKQQGDHTAAEIAEARRRATKAKDRGVGIAAIRRRNGDFNEETEEEREERKKMQAKYSRRKLVSNYDRYEEETEQDRLEKDAELGIDRETTDLVSMLENTDEGSSTFFKFKEEQLFEKDIMQQKQNLLEIDFKSLTAAFGSIDIQQLLGLSESDNDLVHDALTYQPIVLDKPFVPAFTKNAKGYVLFNKQQQQQQQSLQNKTEGIYLRNDGSNHRVALSVNKPVVVETEQSSHAVNNEKEKDTKTDELIDDLDELLAHTQVNDAPMNKPSLPKPGSIKKKPTAVIVEDNKDDEAWLDDLLDK